MPSDRLTFAVGVGGQVDVARLLSRVADFFDGACLFFRHDVFRQEAVIDLDAQIALGKVAHVPDGRFYVIPGAEDAGNRSRLGGRLDHNEALVVPRRHRHVPSAARAPAAALDWART